MEDERIDFPCSEADLARWIAWRNMDEMCPLVRALALGGKVRGTPGQVAACVAWLARNPAAGQAPPLERL